VKSLDSKGRPGFSSRVRQGNEHHTSTQVVMAIGQRWWKESMVEAGEHAAAIASSQQAGRRYATHVTLPLNGIYRGVTT